MNEDAESAILKQLEETHKMLAEHMKDLNREMREIKVRITEMNQ